jgi:hypothetical protein
VHRSLARREGGYGDRHPSPPEVLLIVEVADTSRRADRDRKIPLYAAEGIVEVWLEDVEQRRLEIYRDPQPRAYASVTLVGPGSALATLAFPDVVLSADDLLP